MSVIIRLQNLPWSANSLDIRHYFRGLSIPEGGVHIVGGEMGDAFIAFSTDEDARQAMMLAGGKIKEVQITLMLSSRSEMQKVIEAARQASMTNSLAQLLGSQNVPPIPLNQQQQQQQQPQQQQQQPQTQVPQQQHAVDKDRRDSKEDKKDSSDLSSSSYDTIRKDKKENSRSRSRDRMRKDRRDRDRDRERRRRSRSRSRSRDRRRRRSHSRSRGRDTHNRDRERKDLREDLKKDKDLGSNIVHSLQDATNLPNLEILNPNQWRGVLNPSNLSHNPPPLNSLTNLDLIRNFPGPKPLLQSGTGNTGNGNGGMNTGPTPLFNNVEMKEGNQAERYQNVPGNEEMGYGNRSRSGEFNNSNHGRRDNRDNFNRDNDMNGGNSRDGGNIVPDNGRGNFRNYEEMNAQNFQGNFSSFGENNLFDIGNNFQNASGFHQRNGNEGMNGNRYNNFNHGDSFPPKMVNANNWDSGMGRGYMEFPMGMQNEGFNRNDRYDNHSRDDRVDEFGRSIQLRNWKNNVSGEKFGDEEFHRNQSGSFSTFHNRFSQNSGSSGPQPLLRNRDSWPPSRGINQDGFKDRRGFRSGGYDEGSRGSFRNDHQEVGSRFPGRSRREEFHGRDRSRFGEKISRDDRSKCDRDSCVEIRGLSPSIAYGDVRRPFNSLKVIIRDIKFLDYTKHDKKCRLKFLNYENKMKALQNSKKIIIEGKHVQMLHINDSEFEDCIDEGVKRTEVKFSEDEEEIVSPNDAYVQVKDLLPEHTESDVAKALAPAVVERIVFESNHEGKVKTALVKFTKPIDAKVALNTPNRKIGDCNIMLASLSPREFIERVKKMEKSPAAESPSKRETEKTDVIVLEEEDKTDATDKKEENDCITMKNLPYEANDRDICDFFSDIGLVPKRIHLMLDARGQPSGNAYCEFSEPEQAQAACSKNGMPIGKNTLVVQKVSREEMNEALGLKSESGNQSGSRSQNANQNNSGKSQCVVALENIPFRAGVFDIINFFGWSYRLTEDDICRRYNDQGQPTGDARVSFRTQEDALKAVRFLNNRHMMGRSIRMKII